MSIDFAIFSDGARPAEQRVQADAPPTVSSRRHLRHGLPDIYRRDSRALRDQPPPFAMRFLHALEEVLDPVAATLDSLPAHLNADLAPEHALSALATWLGVDEVESLPAAQRREAVRRAGELGRLRGTRAGLELALSLFFPAVALRVEDGGGVVVGDEADAAPAKARAATFNVFCDEPLAPEMQMAVARCIERWKPVHAHYKLRVRKGKKHETLDVPTISRPGITPPELKRPFEDESS